VSKYKQHRFAGSSHPGSKLTNQQVQAIREMHAGGASYSAIGRIVGIHNTTVMRICKRQMWRHI